MNFYKRKEKAFTILVMFCISSLVFSQSITAPKFQDTQGEISVDTQGHLEYNLSIETPAGVKGVGPEISLKYNSSAVNGIAGYGWNITGITSIMRTGKTIDKDGELKAVQLDYSDHYTFNGQKLILKSGEYGKDGAEYVTEKYSNAKIRSLGNQTNWKQPLYWEVTFEDGSQAWYGGTSSTYNDAANRLSFNIVKWKDTEGNVINYNYEQQDNFSLIKSITWGGNEKLGKSSFNEITFNYTNRNIYESAYVNGAGTLFTQSKLLQNIIVKTNTTIFKKYVVEYFTDNTGYQYVKKITESNSADETANSAEFTYPLQKPTEISGWDINSQALFDDIKFTGDFNGDSYLDFIMNDGTIKLGAFNDDFNVVQTNKTFNANSLVVNSLIDETGKVYNGNGVVEYKDYRISGYIFRDNNFVKVFDKLTPITCDCEVELKEGDINGDGISDVFLTEKASPLWDFNSRYVVDLKSTTTPIWQLLLDVGLNESLYTNQKYVDVDGDGKVDIINVSNTNYTVFEFVKYASNQYLKKIKYSANLEDTKGNDFPVLYGDYNGDGKLDFAIPIAEKSVGLADWKFYIGTGQSFNTVFKPDFLMYKSEANQSNGAWLRFSRTNYSVTDLNADGKSDIVQVFSYSNLLTSTTRTVGVTINSMISKGAMASGGLLNFDLQNIYTYPAPGTYTVYTPVDDLAIYLPITNTLRSNNNYYNVFLYRKENILKIKAPTGIDELKRIQSITQGGVTTSVKYLELTPDNTANTNFYKKLKDENYPFYSLNRIDKGFAVSQLEQQGRKQDFRYRGSTANLQGRGMIGYHQSARSSWYADGLENTKIWYGTEIDPLKEGLPIKEWSIRTNNELKVFPTDISVNNTELLTFKSTDYQIDKLINSQVVTIIPDADKAKVVTTIKPFVSIEKDFLESKTTTNYFTYGEYYLPTEVISNVNNGYGISTSTYTYYNNASGIGEDYYIGRPERKIDLVEAYGDSKSSMEEYYYENNKVKIVKSWNRDKSGYIQNAFNYDGFGNIISKVISNSLDTQKENTVFKYDTTGRFIVSTTDNLGLETLFEHNVWGQVLKQTDPFGNTVINTYDNWGKQLTLQSSLTGTATYIYDIDNNYNRTITKTNPDGDISKSFSNKLGQEYKTTAKAFANGQYISKESQFDILGRKIKESEPYFDGQNVSKWNLLTYDDSVYPAKVTSTTYNGKISESTISGLTTTVKEITGYARTKTSTVDVLGNIVNTTDKGGSIQFSYNAVGEQIKSQYAENIVTTAYDVWGRRSEFNDPSNGLYKYEYTGLGNPKKIISPKGTKEFKYNSLGQLNMQIELSTFDGNIATKKNIAYTYNSKGMLATKGGAVNGKVSGTILTYDSQGRLISTVETSNGKTFSHKNIIYDNIGKIASYDDEIQSSGVITKAQIQNVYSPWNGDLSQVKDKVTGKILWELQTSNENDEVLTAKLGEVNILNSYNTNTGSLSGIKHSTPSNSIFELTYAFDVIKNNLQSRTRDGIVSVTESFSYDDDNRLIGWTNPETGFTSSSNEYDVKGRIIKNDQVGTMKYENSAKIYQPTSVTLNSSGTFNYNNDLIQQIAYNENNDPVFIDGIKGDVAFQYGITSMRQRVTYGGNFSADTDGKFTKFYNEDARFEVVKNNETGNEKHIIYVGGTPYDSNIVYLKNFDETTPSYRFLHKDYLGSILAITNELGDIVEQRHFDAWGRITHIKMAGGKTAIGNNVYSAIEALGMLVDRGYTSHEHFYQVGIIHMNGRLYDPLLRRFLNADENIQDPFFTQNYNKYGYAYNNPLIYADPDGEWVWIVVGAVVGAYVTGAKANGSWDPTKWNWQATWGKIAMGAAVGAFTGGVGAAVGTAAATYAAAAWGISGGVIGGAIAGAAGGLVAGSINGFATSAMFGEDVLKGTLYGGAQGFAMGGAFGGIAGGVGQIIKNARGGPQASILKGAPLQPGRNQWTLNNTPKTTTLGAIPKVGSGGGKYSVTVGELDGAAGRDIIKLENSEIAKTVTQWDDFHPVNTDQTPIVKTQSLVQANRIAGNKFRDELAEALRAEGRIVNTEVYKKTPYGKRFMDIEVRNSKGELLGGVETKVGGSRYHTLQRLKDDWLRANGYPVQVVRQPSIKK